MKLNITLQDIRNLLSRTQTATAFKNKITLEEVAKNLREFLEMFEAVFVRFENIEEIVKKNKNIEAEQKKLRREIERVKVDLHNVARLIKNAKKN